MCVTHVTWCMSGSLSRDDGENVPGIPGACATRNFTYLAGGPWPFIISGTSFLIGYLVAVAVILENFPSRYKGVLMSILCCSWWLGQSFFNYLYTVTKSDSHHRIGNIFLLLGLCIFVVKGLGAFLVQSVPLDEDDVESSTLIEEGNYLAKAEKAYSSTDGYSNGTNQQTITSGELTESWMEKIGLKMFLDLDFQLATWGFVTESGIELMYMGDVSIIASALFLGDLYETTLIVAPLTSMVIVFVGGWLSDKTRNIFPRGLFPAVVRLCSAIMFAISAVYGTTGAVFVITTIVVYSANGISYSILNIIVDERFGMLHFKRNLGLILMASSLMTLAMATLFGALYDKAIIHSKFNVCRGIICVQEIFATGSVMSFVSSICFVLLERRNVIHCLKRIISETWHGQ